MRFIILQLISMCALLIGSASAQRELTLHERWTYETDGVVSTPTAITDVDGRAIGIAMTEAGGSLLALDKDGTLLWHHPLAPETNAAPAAGDINGDGRIEIVAADAQGWVVCWSQDGDELWRYKLDASVKPFSGVALGDLDGNGDMETIVTDHGGNVTCLSSRGMVLWRFSGNAREIGAPLLVDVNGDGSREVIFTAHTNRIFCLSADGRLIWVAYDEDELMPNSTPVVADLNGDGTPELYVGGGMHFLLVLDPITGELALKHDAGTHLNGALSLGDIDRDGISELLTSSKMGRLECWAGDQTPEWQIQREDIGIGQGGPMADLDGDGAIEVLWPCGSSPSLAINADGTEHSRMSALYQTSWPSHSLVTDFGGGTLALVVAGHGPSGQSITCYGLDSPDTSAVPWPQYRGNPTLDGNPPDAPQWPQVTFPEPEQLTGAGIKVELPDKIFTGRNDVWFSIASGTPKTTSFVLTVEGPDGRQIVHKAAWPADTRQMVEFSVLSAGRYRLVAEAVTTRGSRREILAEYEWDHEPYAVDLKLIKEWLQQLSVHNGSESLHWQGVAANTQRMHEESSDLEDAATTVLPNSLKGRELADRVTQLRKETGLLLTIATAIQARETRGENSTVMTWQINPWGIFNPAKYPPPQERGELRIQACIGEHESAAVALFNITDRPLEVRLWLDDMTGPDGVKFSHRQVEISRVVEVPYTVGETIGDALSPLGSAQVVTVPGWTAQIVWFTFHTKDLVPGEYTGQLMCQPLEYDTPAELMPVSVDVLPVEIPNKSPLHLCMWTNGTGDWLEDYPEETLEDLVSHYYDVFTPITIPRGTYDSEGNPTTPIDYEVHDRMVRRLSPNGFLFFMGPAGGITVEGTERFSPVWQKAYTHYLAEWMAHLEEMGVERDEFAFYPQDEPTSIERAQPLIMTARATRVADPTIQIYTDPTTGSRPEFIEHILPLVDIFCPSQELLDRDAHWLLPMLREAGKQIWSYDAPGKAKTLSHFNHQRFMPWQAWVEGFEAIGYWVYSHHSGDVSRWMSSIYIHLSIFSTVYEGRGPIPSKRWESLREGMEDWLLLNELKQAYDKASTAGASESELSHAHALLYEKPREMMNMLRESGRYLTAPSSPDAHDRMTEALENSRREMVAEIMNLRTLTD
jgi:outer membrane protein assembly factor BamB